MFRVKGTFSIETHDPLLAAVAPTGHLESERSIGGDDGAHLMMVVIVMVMMVMVMMVMVMMMMMVTIKVKRDRKSSLAGNTSFIFPGRRVASAVHNRRLVMVLWFIKIMPMVLFILIILIMMIKITRLDQLVSQLVEWSVSSSSLSSS